MTPERKQQIEEQALAEAEAEYPFNIHSIHAKHLPQLYTLRDMMEARQDVHESALVQERMRADELLSALGNIAGNDDWTAAGMRMYAADALANYSNPLP